MDSLKDILKKKSRSELEELIVQIMSNRTEYLVLLGIEGFEDEYEEDEEWYDE